MEETQTVCRTGEPVTQAEGEQAGYALRELARDESDPGALRVSQEQLDVVRPFFVLGWAMGVRTGHTAAAMAGVPVDQETVTRAFGRLVSGRLMAAQSAGPALWQKVDYHGSVTQRHGVYWVCGIHTYADPFGEEPEVRYDLCEIRGVRPVPVVSGVRRASLTSLPVYRAAL